MIVRRLIELVTPVSCLGCDNEGTLLCAVCAGLVTIPAPTCLNCGKLQAAGATCASCRRHTALSGAYIATHYEDTIRQLVLALKFNRARAATAPAVALINRVLPNDLARRYDGITAVPVAPSRHRERGYNQSELMARALASQLHLNFQPTLRRQGSVHQLGAGRNARLHQVEHAFEPLRSLTGRWLIVDDVMTTGATLDACAAAMRLAGATEVTAIVLAGQRG